MISKYAFRLFGDVARRIEIYFPDLKDELKRADLKFSPEEYIANALFAALVSFIVTLPFLSFSFSLASGSFMFGYLTSITLSLGLPIVVFLIYINYPKSIIKQREKEIDIQLPFSTLYLSSIVSSEVTLPQAMKIFINFSTQNSVVKEVKKIVNDTELYGLDIVSALERAIGRTPSRKFRELLYGILATIRSGGNLYVFLKERTADFFMDYKRRLSEFSHSMMIYTQIYLVAVVLGTIFFVILTSTISAIGGATQNILGLQLFMILVFLPMVSILFLFLVKKAQPFWE